MHVCINTLAVLVKIFSMAENLRRQSSVASPRVGLDSYMRVLQAWQQNAGQTVDSLAGPQLVSELRQVTPSIMVRLSDLIKRLIDAGCENVTIYTSKF